VSGVAINAHCFLSECLPDIICFACLGHTAAFHNTLMAGQQLAIEDWLAVN
jgi:hypothetical protein